MEKFVDEVVRYRVRLGPSGMWDVNEEGFDVPIASFNRREDAVGYVHRLAATKRRSEVCVEDR